MKRNSSVEDPESAYKRISSGMSLTDRVTEVLLEKISKGELPPNSRLPTEQEMSERFGVSRSVIRESVSRLKSKGLVITKQGSGAFVCKARPEVAFQILPDPSDFLKSTLDITELRRALESEMAFLAATRRTQKNLAQIRKAFLKIREAVDAGGDGIAEDLEFCLAIANAAKNPIFAQVLRFVKQYSYHHGFVRIIRTGLREFNDRREAEHAAIVKAIERRDPEAAQAAVREHLLNAARRIEEAESQFWKGRSSEVAPQA
jgi:GntR family transcriptional regulator, transcriptional repressor for pyruvate dehydrogenase complex